MGRSIVSVCRRMLHVTARDFTSFFIFQVFMFARLGVYHSFLLFVVSGRQIFSSCGCWCV